MSVKITCDKKERKDSLERALEARERRRTRESRERRERREGDHVGLHHHLIITKQCPWYGRIPGQRDNLNIINFSFTLGSAEDST